MAKLTIKKFFLLLDAPLRNPSWSWGAITTHSQDVVFRVWLDEIEMINGKPYCRLTLHKKWEVMDPLASRGYEERKWHIERAIKKGRAFFVYCHADNLDAVPRKIAGYDHNAVGYCPNITQDAAQDFWGEQGQMLTINEYHRMVRP